MTRTTTVSLEEYLNTSYEPDMDFVDGVLVSRNVGTKAHARLQTIVANYFSRFQQSHGIAALTGARLLVSATGRHRIPDVLVLKTPFQDERVVTEIPLAIVEIQSPDDTLSDIMDRCIDYENRGVRLILILDPVKRRSWMFQSGGLQTLGDSLRVDLAGKAADLSFAEMFAELASSFDRAPG